MKGYLRARLDAFGIRPKKRFGQNFLHDPQILAQIAGAVESTSPKKIIEIGPGPGLLTERLASLDIPMWAIEKDRELVELLQEKIGPTFPNLTVIDADFLEVELQELGDSESPTLVGNIPYNISTPILLRLLSQRHNTGPAILMLQAELAQRLRAPVGSRASGSLTVLLALLSSIKLVTAVPAGAFFPPPKVQSEVIRIDWHSDNERPNIDLETFERTVRAGFNQRRKKLGNALTQKWPRALVDEAIHQSGIDANLRAESLSLEQWIGLANALKNSEGDTESHSINR